jgi:polysaccharide export outer membrane protein
MPKQNFMKQIVLLNLLFAFLLAGCTSQHKLAYLNSHSETGGEEYFTMEIPDYKIQQRDVLYITIKALTPDGTVKDFLSTMSGAGAFTQNEAGQYIYGFNVDANGEIRLPVLGTLKVSGMTLKEAENLIQGVSDKTFTGATVECKLLSFKFTVIGEVRAPGTYINYNNYLTILEAIGRAGGIGDLGRRDKITVIRPTDGGTRIYNLNLQDKSILSSEAYFLLPNDVVIVEPEAKKIFSLNLPTYSFILTSITSVITTTLLLINYLK